jgi:hypothetical protein
MSKIDVEIQLRPDGKLHEVGIWVGSTNGKDLTAQAIIDAVAEALLLHWEHHDMTPIPPEGYDS